MRAAEKQGHRLVLLISLMALPVRGVIAAWLLNRWSVYLVAAASVALWIVFAPSLKPACAGRPEFDETTPPAADAA